MWKKLLCINLALILVVALFSVCAFAVAGSWTGSAAKGNSVTVADKDAGGSKPWGFTGLTVSKGDLTLPTSAVSKGNLTLPGPTVSKNDLVIPGHP